MEGNYPSSYLGPTNITLALFNTQLHLQMMHCPEAMSLTAKVLSLRRVHVKGIDNCFALRTVSSSTVGTGRARKGAKNSYTPSSLTGVNSGCRVLPSNSFFCIVFAKVAKP